MNEPLKYACKLLTVKDLFSSEIRSKMKKKGFSEGEIEDSISKLLKLNYLDDEELLPRYLRHYLEKGMGPLLIRQKLQAKGVRVEFDLPFDEQEEVINRLMEKHAAKPKEKMFQFLMRRGFEVDVIRQVWYNKEYGNRGT